MNKQQFTQLIKKEISDKINSRLENELPLIKDQLIKSIEIIQKLLNEEYNTNYSLNIESLVNAALYTPVNKTMTNNQIELKFQELTNTYYSYSELEDYLRNSADDIGYNDKNIYLSNGWEEIEINFKYTLTDEYDIIIHSIN